MSTDEPLLLDVMLGKLATYLRMCGYDARYAGEEGIEADDKIRELAAREGRRLLTRDRQLAAGTEGAILLDSKEIESQLSELDACGFEITLPEEPRRCSVCNGRVHRVDEDETRPDHAPDNETPLWQCVNCGQYFWKGSHWERVEKILTEVDSTASR